jgi:endonuclease YncB( thermonuclease family)
MSDGQRPATHARTARLLIVAACIVGVWLALLAARHFAGVPDAAQTRAPAIPPLAEAPPMSEKPVDAAAAAAPEPPRAVRDVTPGGVARVYMSPPAPAKGKRATSIRITQAGVKPDGTIAGDGGTVRLYGVSFPEAKKVCQAASGESWPCGRRAYIALHNRIAAETVNCEPRVSADPPAADCFVGDVNLAAWMLGQGLARLASDVADQNLVAAEDGAKKAKLGLWQDPGEAAAPMSARRH